MAGIGLSYIVNIMLIVHALKTGRQYYWIFIIMTPVIGPIAYVLVELLPELSNDYRAKRAFRGIKRTLDPGADLRRHQKQNKLSGSVDAKRHLAAELVAASRFDEAIDHYRKALTGLYEWDPEMMLGLAQAYFGAGHFDQTKITLDQLIEHNPEFKSPDGHLLYARSVEASGDIDAALEEYEAVSGTYPGLEAKIRYANLLEENGHPDKAKAAYDEALTTADLSPKFFKNAQKRWINAARDGLRRLQE